MLRKDTTNGDVATLMGVQIPPPAPTNKPLNLEQYLLSTSTLEKCTISRRVKALKRSSKCVDLSDSNKVARASTNFRLRKKSLIYLIETYIKKIQHAKRN